MVVGRLVSFWEGLFSGAMLNFGRVINNNISVRIFFPFKTSNGPVLAHYIINWFFGVWLYKILIDFIIFLLCVPQNILSPYCISGPREKTLVPSFTSLFKQRCVSIVTYLQTLSWWQPLGPCLLRVHPVVILRAGILNHQRSQNRSNKIQL